MGNKSDRKGKFVLLYLAVSCITAAATIVSCAPVQDTIVQIKAHQQLEQYRTDMAAGFFETVIEQSKQVLAENDAKPPADVALYTLGEVYAHHNYIGRDYNLSRYYFEKLITNFPDSRLTSEAKTYVSLFETIAAKEKEAAAVEQELKEQELKQKKSADKEADNADEKPVPHEIIVDQSKKTPVAGRGKIVKNHNFEEAVENNLQIVEELGNQKPADEALYNLGLIYAHFDNPVKDYSKSKFYFQELSRQFPESAFAEEAMIWLGLFETIEKIQQIDIEIEQQKKQLTQ